MPKKARTTLKSIAEQLGVSTTAVSHVLNGNARLYRISRQTEENVQALASKLSFAPNQLARSLRLSRSQSIGLVVPDISNPFFASTARGVEDQARQRGFSVLLCDTQDNTDVEKQVLRLLESRNVDGLVVLPVGQSCEHLLRYEDGRTPLVVVDRFFPTLKVASVTSDNYAGARDAVEHLISRGHRVIGGLQGLPGTLPNEDRLRGYRDALARHRLKHDAALIAGEDFGERSGYTHALRLLKARPDITAILTLSSPICLGAFRAMAELKLKVPEDVSIVCFDDPPYAPFFATALTTVAQQNEEMGRRAAKMLFERIERGGGAGLRAGGRKGEIVQLPTKLIERQSVLDLAKIRS
ncbi:MAG TPA: LacI family DNA-binding transcriptional regulator [Planctomycetota bacterium]|jgi:LacI family transcriptional regulator